MPDMTGVHQHLVTDLVNGIRPAMFVGLNCLSMFGHEEIVSCFPFVEPHTPSCCFPFVFRRYHELQGFGNFRWSVSHQGRNMRETLAKNQLGRSVLG